MQKYHLIYALVFVSLSATEVNPCAATLDTLVAHSYRMMRWRLDNQDGFAHSSVNLVGGKVYGASIVQLSKNRTSLWYPFILRSSMQKPLVKQLAEM